MRRGSVILTAVANLPQQALVDLCQGKHRERLMNDFRCGPIRVGKSGKGKGLGAGKKSKVGVGQIELV